MRDGVIKKWFNIITDHRISLRERMFRLVTVICMIAIAFTLPMGRSIWNILMLLALGTTAAGGMDVKGRVTKVIILATEGGCLVSSVGLYFADVLLCILWAIEIAVILPKAEEKP